MIDIYLPLGSLINGLLHAGVLSACKIRSMCARLQARLTSTHGTYLPWWIWAGVLEAAYIFFPVVFAFHLATIYSLQEKPVQNNVDQESREVFEVFNELEAADRSSIPGRAFRCYHTVRALYSPFHPQLRPPTNRWGSYTYPINEVLWVLQELERAPYVDVKHTRAL
jgi:hypothetical protein